MDNTGEKGVGNTPQPGFNQQQAYNPQQDYNSQQAYNPQQSYNSQQAYDSQQGNMMAQMGNQTRYVPEQYKNGKNPTKAIILSFLIMVAFLAIQVVVMIPFVIGGMFKTAVEIKANSEILDEEEILEALMGSIDAIGLSLIATFVSLLVAVLWYKLVYCKGYGISDLKRTMKRVFVPRTIGGLFLAALGLFYLINYLMLLFELLWPSALEEYNSLMESAGIDELDWKVIILTVVMAPINEECIMRGIIFTKLKKNMAPIVAILISALYFGIFHMNVVQGTYAALLGIFMAYLAYKYKSIVAPMLFHAMFNGLNYLLVLLPTWVQESAILGIVVPLACGVAWFFLEWKRKIADIE